MRPDLFRKIALEMPEADEGGHQGHPDFRVRNKIFATLAPDGEHGVLKLDPEQQAEHIEAHPEVFDAVPGGWGARGYTRVILKAATRKLVAPAMALAWLNTAPKPLAREYRVDPS